MSSPQATVNRVLTYSVVDGPGNRLVLFLQGCNFACTTCHNPYTIGSCNDCGLCVPVCPTGALKMEEGRVLFEEKLCTQCDLCLDICPISASPMTRLMSVEAVLEIARRHRAFLNGITVSGGEATLQLKFLVALFTAVKTDSELSDLTCFVDSNGHLGETGWQRLLPVTDGVMLDIKAFDPKLHQALTGRGNDRSLHSAHILHAAGKLHELRFLMIPGHTDSAAELERLAQLAVQFGDIRIKLNAFRHHGVRGAARQWPVMERESVEAAASFLRSVGFREVVTPAVCGIATPPLSLKCYY